MSHIKSKKKYRQTGSENKTWKIQSNNFLILSQKPKGNLGEKTSQQTILGSLKKKIYTKKNLNKIALLTSLKKKEPKGKTTKNS